MGFPTPKELKALAKACRKSGIKSLKGEGFEITLTESLPVSEARKATARLSQGNLEQDTPEIQDSFDSLTLEEKLFWSSTNQAEKEIVTGET